MLGGNIYYVSYKHAGQAVEISFDVAEKEFVFQPARSETKIRVKPKGLTKADLMGELGQFEQLPAYQLSLPFNGWGLRQQEYVQNLAVLFCRTSIKWGRYALLGLNKWLCCKKYDYRKKIAISLENERIKPLSQRLDE